MKLLQDAGFLLIVITNQSGIARGYYTEEDFQKLNDWMLDKLKENGINITNVYYCPHLPDAAIEKYRIDCNCRKPKTGMFMQAVNDYHINLSKSYVLGDKLRDCAICNEYDCTGFIIGGQYSSSPQDAIRAKFLGNLFYVKDFLDAVHFIITNN